MFKNPFVAAFVFIYVIGSIIFYERYYDKRVEADRANHRITELTQTIQLNGMRINTLESEASYQRRRAEICESREHLREQRDAERRARRDSLSVDELRW